MLLKLKTHFIKYSLLKHLYSYSKPKEERASSSEFLVSYEWFLNCAMYIVRMYAPPLTPGPYTPTYWIKSSPILVFTWVCNTVRHKNLYIQTPFSLNSKSPFYILAAAPPPTHNKGLERVYCLKWYSLCMRHFF